MSRQETLRRPQRLRLDLNSNRKLFGVKCARVCNRSKSDMPNSLNPQAIGVELEVQSRKVQPRRDDAINFE
jgi:hypothetical protein